MLNDHYQTALIFYFEAISFETAMFTKTRPEC